MNPYEPPQTPAEPPLEGECLVAWPASGAYVYYQTLVWQPDSPLPAVCVRSGLAADDTLTLTMTPLIDDDGSITRAFELKQPLYDVRLPVNRSAVRHRAKPRLGLILLLTGIAVGILSLGAEGLELDLLAWPLFAVGAAVALVLIGFGLRLMARPPQIQLLCVDRGFLQLFGLHPAFLAALPEWPVPDRDSARPS